MPTLHLNSPAPTIVSWSAMISPSEAFELGRLGMRSLLPAQPLPSEAFGVLHAGMREPLATEAHIRSLVGHLGVDRVVGDVRRVMLDQALRLSRDNRSRTARLLSVSRQAVQQLLGRRLDRQRDASTLAPRPRASGGVQGQ